MMFVGILVDLSDESDYANFNEPRHRSAMSRLALTILLIANVLVCPYFCMGQIAAGGPYRAEDRSCPCCSKSPSSPSPGHDQNSPNLPRENGGDCLCHGAITNGAKLGEYESPAADLSVALPIPQNDVTACSPISQLPQLFCSQFPPLCSGRELCTLTCVFLI